MRGRTIKTNNFSLTCNQITIEEICSQIMQRPSSDDLKKDFVNKLKEWNTKMLKNYVDKSLSNDPQNSDYSNFLDSCNANKTSPTQIEPGISFEKNTKTKNRKEINNIRRVSVSLRRLNNKIEDDADRMSTLNKDLGTEQLIDYMSPPKKRQSFGYQSTEGELKKSSQQNAIPLESTDPTVPQLTPITGVKEDCSSNSIEEEYKVKIMIAELELNNELDDYFQLYYK